MRYFKNKAIETTISKLSLGTLHFGVFLDQKSASRLTDFAIEHGINLFDTAPMYGNGQSEAMLGQSLGSKRKDVLIASKVGLKAGQDELGNFRCVPINLNKENITKSVNKSLSILKTDYIDILQLHAYDYCTELDDTCQALEALISDGKIRYVGCSNFDQLETQNLFSHCAKLNIPIVSSQIHYNLLQRRAETELFDFCESKNISVLINRGLAKGILSAKYKLGNSFPKNSRALSSPRLATSLDANMCKLSETISNTAEKFGKSAIEASLQWLFKGNKVSSVVVGTRNITQLAQCINSIENEMNSELSIRLDEAIADLGLLDYVYSQPATFLEL